MIQLHPDYLIFHTEQGENIPCSAETVTIELIGEAASALDPEVVREAAAAVVHYFKTEMGKEQVSVAEFSQALERVLHDFGYSVSSASTNSVTPEKNGNPERSIAVTDLSLLAQESLEDAFELLFFQRLRTQFQKLAQTPSEVLKFEGLHRCVKKLLGVKRWGSRCERLSDQIVHFLRECLALECATSPKGLVVL